MKLMEIFNRGQSPEKLIKKIAKQLSDRSGYLHLAHTKTQHRKNKEYFDREVEKFRKLQRRFHEGEDVTNELKEMSKRISLAFKKMF